MSLQISKGKLSDKRSIAVFAAVCWAAYFTAYLGRLNYSACLVEISASEGWSKTEAGLIPTGFFVCYGLCQLVNGVVGDRISPKLMVGCGLAVSGIINLIFPMASGVKIATLLWCINGLFQSMIWSPLMRVLAEWMPEEKRLSSCAGMSSTIPCGTLTVYILSAVLVYMGSWKAVFICSGTILLIMSAVWFIIISSLERRVQPEAQSPAAVKLQETQEKPLLRLILAGAIPFCFIALLMQGALKDGVTAWIPSFLEERFALSSATAIFSTTLVPAVNLLGVLLASWLNRRFIKNELLSAALFFSTALLGLVLLPRASENSAALSLGLLALNTGSMMGINAMLVGLLPSYFARFGRCSTISGIVNTAANLGCAASTYLNGALIERYGWGLIMIFWCILASAGLVFCLLACRRWKKFREGRE